MKYLLALVGTFFMLVTGAIAQPCPGASRDRTNRGTVTEHALFTAQNYRVLSFYKETALKDKGVAPRYYVVFNGMMKKMLPDSLVGTFGDLELVLTNGRKIVFKGAEATINPYGRITCLDSDRSLRLLK